jgi:hypothetical protein
MHFAMHAAMHFAVGGVPCTPCTWMPLRRVALEYENGKGGNGSGETWHGFA